MPREDIYVHNVQFAVNRIIPYLEGTAHKAVYFEGWNGLGASAVLRAIAERPPPSLTKKFDKIIHIDCSRWKSRRALQRAILDELKLSGHVMAHLDRQDEEDDFSGVQQASRAEIRDVTREINQTLRNLSYMVIFHNGSDNMVDMADFGFFQFECPVLWTFRGRFYLNKEIQKKVDSSHLFVDASGSYTNYNELIEEEAREITLYAHKHGITPVVARDCYMYLLSLNYCGDNIMDYCWATHASNYWVCDGIVEGDKDSQAAWDVARALHQETRLNDYSSSRLHMFCSQLNTPPRRWHTSSDIEEKAHPETTSLFLAPQRESDQRLGSLPDCMFQQADQLRVLKLCGCTFNFSSPPFHCCYNLRFLGLDSCMDQENMAEDEKKGAAAMEIFQRLWVLDVCQTDWELPFPEEIQEQVATNIREVHITKGRIWRSSLAWRQLQNLRKLRVIDPISSWETGKKDEFTDMEKLELLDLSGNTTMQVLPSLSSATCLRTLVLDGCVGLDHIGPEGLPPTLETFSLDARSDKLLKISLSGCAHLESFLLRGELPGLEELNLSGTSVRRVDLSEKVVQVKGLKKVFLMGCKQLRAILWWQEERQLEVLCIDTFETEDTCPHYSDPSTIQHRNYVVAADARIIQSLLTKEYGTIITSSLYLDLHMPTTSSSSKSKGPSRDKVIPKPCYYTYSDVFIQRVSTYDSEMKWPPPLGHHMEVGEGISLIDMESDKGIKAICYVTLRCIYSLHVHDNSCILAVTPKLPLDSGYYVFVLKWCRVERCPKLETVFASSSIRYMFVVLEAIWVSDLPAAACIWSKGSIYDGYGSFGALESIHLHKCPRLKFVLPLSRNTYLPKLKTLHITQCGDLKQVFPWDDVVVPRQHRGAGHTVKKFPNLKHVLLHDLFSLQEICEAKMLAPMLESVRIRGCWGLKRLPTIGNNSHQPVVHCEEDWWTKLEWDGLQAGHDPSLYEPRYSSAYYKKRFLRGTVLR